MTKKVVTKKKVAVKKPKISPEEKAFKVAIKDFEKFCAKHKLKAFLVSDKYALVSNDLTEIEVIGLKTLAKEL